MRCFVHILICLMVISNPACSKNEINIQSYILRDRVIVSDRVFMKKALYLSFTINAKQNELKKLRAKGTLIWNKKILSNSHVNHIDHQHVNMFFDLPFEIPNGMYTIKIAFFNYEGEKIAAHSFSINRDELKNSFQTKNTKTNISFEEITTPSESEYFKPRTDQIENGYIIFSRSPLEYVFPKSRPKYSEVIDRLSLRVVRNEFEPITFSIYPLGDLGKVTISIDDLKGDNAFISKDNIEVAYIEAVEDTIGLHPGKFQYVPKLIRPGNQVEIVKGECRRFWLTIKIDKTVFPGEYTGRITILPQTGEKKNLPLKIKVEPIILEDLPGIDYFMLMTYEFTELTMPWSIEEKDKIYKSAVNILRDYKEHGITTLCPHSPFFAILNEDGSINLEDIYATLRAARDNDFKRPIIWYMGHLIQTAKPKHPGNILGFDQSTHIARLKHLVKTVSGYARKNNCPKVIFLPIDEPDDSYQDFRNRRRDMTPLLLKTIKDSGAENMLTFQNYNQFKPVDYICSSKLNQEHLEDAHGSGDVYWMYNNTVTTNCMNSAYARYMYGLYTWKNQLDGMSSWTFQNTQNASGWPTKVDSPGKDIYLAYPDPEGPLATPTWEAVREGIDDHKLIYQLIKRINKLRKKGLYTSQYEEFLDRLRKNLGSPGHQFEDYNRWDPVFFQKNRDELISLIMEANNRLSQ